MKQIKIYFEGFWRGFDYENNFIINILRKHYKVFISKKPDYLFYSVFNDKYLKYDCVRIFYSGENLSPDFNVCDFAIAYDDIKFGDRYLRFPLWLLYDQYFKKENIEGKTVTTLRRIINDSQREKFCSFVYSNGRADPIREALLDKISEYRQVDSGGRYKNNTGEAVKDKVAFEAEYKFSIACENVSQKGYTTEKIVEAFVAGTIPIYWGDPDIVKVFNERAFINCGKFQKIEDIVKEIERVDEDEKLYRSMVEQPVLINLHYIDDKYAELEMYLINIIEQPYELARKNAPYYWKRIYLKKLMQGTVIFGIIDQIKCLLRTWELIWKRKSK